MNFRLISKANATHLRPTLAHLCQALLAVICVSTSLRFLGFVSTMRLVRATCRLRQFVNPRMAPETKVETLVRAVQCVVRRAPMRITCLPRSSAIYWLLFWYGYQPQIQFGFNASERCSSAHAWVEIDGTPVGEPPGIRSQFTVFRKSGYSPSPGNPGASSAPLETDPNGCASHQS